MILFCCLISLIPIFKADGYWIISDLLDISNLDNNRFILINYILKKIMNKPINSPYSSQSQFIIITGYTVISFCAWIYIFYKILRLLCHYF